VSTSPAISVVVPTYQRRGSLLRLLKALRAQTIRPEQFEVVVAIDGSNDGTIEAVGGLVVPFALRCTSHENRGRAATVNEGIARAEGALVLILDDDMEPTPQLLAAHLRAHERPERVAVVGPAPVQLDDGSPAFAKFMGVRFNDVLAEMTARADALRFAEAYTGNLSLRRPDFIEVGGFDGTFDGYGLEDYELALRLVRAGVRLMLAPDAIAYQHYEKTFAAAARDSESRGRSAVLFARLHPAEAAQLVTLRDPVNPSAARRLFRYALPRLTEVLPIAAKAIAWLIGIAERVRVRRLAFVYQLGLEYFFLLGLRDASREHQFTARARYL
jgi:GT2 family glycosyltransferase